jgi:hypothetical protein
VTGTEIEVFVEVGLHDMVDVRRAAGTVGRSAEAGVGALRVPVPVPVSEWGRKQGYLNSLLKACAERREKFRTCKPASSDGSPEE